MFVGEKIVDNFLLKKKLYLFEEIKIVCVILSEEIKCFEWKVIGDFYVIIYINCNLILIL